MKKALIVGGASGIGLAISVALAEREDYDKVYILDKKQLDTTKFSHKITSRIFDITQLDYSLLSEYKDIDTLMITAGFGRLARFEDLSERHIIDSFNVNAVGAIRIIHYFYDRLLSKETFRCGVMVSIAGFMSSPLFSVYASTKAALKIFIESVNVELLKSGTHNCILNISPGSIKGTAFNNGQTDLSLTMPLANEIIENLENGNDLFIPQYEEVYKTVLARYANDFRKEGEHSYEYKMNSGRFS
ncbi:MAG: SDR family oxidoreductase [Muribaculaceae bacterium]|nr:SDR family oxidoreductase [Muribaculaceae bacterium]